MLKTKHSRSPDFTLAAPVADALDAAINSAIATVKADLATKDAANADAETNPHGEALPHGAALQPENPKKMAAKAAKALKAARVATTFDEAMLKGLSMPFLKPKPLDVPPHLDPESGLWIPKNPNAGKPKEPKAPKSPKVKKPPKPLKEVTGQPSRGPNSTTAVVSMKVPLKTALAKAATTNMRSLSAQAALYILEGLKRDGVIQDHPPMTAPIAQAAE